MLFGRSPQMIKPSDALPGRAEKMPVTDHHLVNGQSLTPPFPEGSQTAVFAEGCFWGVERIFWQVPGVIVTAAGYAGGFTPNPTYEEACSGRTGHAEAVLVVFDPTVVTYEDLLRVFWESHDPTQGMGQGNDIGTQYRSGIFTVDDHQLAAAKTSRDAYQTVLSDSRFGEITTEIKPLGDFDDNWFYAEPYHQQYLKRNPNGYCGVAGTGVSCPIGLTTTE
ncbi:MAG: peptide-methionine (S)-S-oxide reductase MsrA [Microthrixaceae bacterium]